MHDGKVHVWLWRRAILLKEIAFSGSGTRKVYLGRSRELINLFVNRD